MIPIIAAPGPWYMQWHHLLPYLSVLPMMWAGVVVWLRSRGK